MKKLQNQKQHGCLAILLTLMFLMLFGCGSNQTENTSETEKQESEVVEDVETTLEETFTVQEKTETTEEVVEYEKANTTDIWKTVEETDDICMVAIDEKTGSELSMNANAAGSDKATPYVIKGEEKIYIPIRNNIKEVFLYYCDGSTDSITLYSDENPGEDYPIVDIDEKLKAVEVEESQKKDYYIMINVEGDSEYTYFLIGYDNQ